jgi:hypothetical protein
MGKDSNTQALNINTEPAFLHGYWLGLPCFHSGDLIAGGFYRPACQETIAYNGEEIFWHGCPGFLAYWEDIRQRSHLPISNCGAMPPSARASVTPATTTQEIPANERRHNDRNHRKASADFRRGQRSGIGRN